jgi:hypothetical protein
VERFDPRSKIIKPGSGLVALTLLMAGTYGSQAFGASWPETNCSESANDAQPEMTLDGLSIDPVDHVTIEPTHSQIDGAALENATEEQITPFLYLAPRVASVVEDVFGEDGDQATADSPSSPLAEHEEVTPYPRPVDNEIQDSVDLRESVLPLLQRQMYRIDI